MESGPADWQILQRDERGKGSLRLSGRWVGAAGSTVRVRMVREDTGNLVCAEMGWQAADTDPNGTWSHTLINIPTGGLYRLETHLWTPAIPSEWSCRGDHRHFLGVGDLWIIAGQSNSAGYGLGPVSDPPELGVHVLRNSEIWALAAHPLNESTDTRHIVNREVANSAHSPYIEFGKVIKAATGIPIGLIQTSLGGSLLSSWNPSEPGESDLFENMVHCVKVAGGAARGIVWYQGEGDTGSGNSETYLDRFVDAVAAWRNALNNPELAVITAQLNRAYDTPTPEGDLAWSLVREAQRLAARRIPNVAVVPTLDLPLSDGVHTSAIGNMLLGGRMARAALGLVYGDSAPWKPPDIADAKLTNGGLTITLTFDNVTSRIGQYDPSHNGFRVEDEAGLARIEKTDWPGASVVLTLGRPVSYSAKVHGGYGESPALVPVDAERAMPILGFWGFPVS